MIPSGDYFCHAGCGTNNFGIDQDATTTRVHLLLIVDQVPLYSPVFRALNEYDFHCPKLHAYGVPAGVSQFLGGGQRPPPITLKGNEYRVSHSLQQHGSRVKRTQPSVGSASACDKGGLVLFTRCTDIGIKTVGKVHKKRGHCASPLL